MLVQAAKLADCRVIGTDGIIGTIADLYFDDERWAVRYLVVDTGGWPTGRYVLIPPRAVDLVDLATGAVTLKLSRREGHCEQSADSQLRSSSEVTGYRIQATDRRIGHVEDFLVDDETWAVRYIIVTTRNWLPGRRVLLAPKAIYEIDWNRGVLVVKQTRRQIETARVFDPSHPPRGDYAAALSRTPTQRH